MFVISPLLAVIALVTIPLTLIITTIIAKRSQKLFVAQWRHTGELNGQIEEAFTGHSLVKVFGRHREVEARFREKNQEMYRASFGAQFISGIIMPAMMFVGNLMYVAIAVVGGLQVASRRDAARRRDGVHPVLAPVHAAAHPARVDGEPAAVGRRQLRARVRAAGRRRAVRGPASAGEPGGHEGAARVRGRLVPLHRGHAAHRGPVAGGAAGPDGRDRRPDRRGQDDAGQPDDALLRPRRRAHHARRRRHRDDEQARPPQPDGHGAAGHVAVQGHDPRQHRLRPAGRDG